MPNWTLRPGEQIRRKQLHDVFGGGPQGGIEPSRSTPNMFLFADSASGEQHGYIDGWQDDGCFHTDVSSRQRLHGNRWRRRSETRAYDLPNSGLETVAAPLSSD